MGVMPVQSNAGLCCAKQLCAFCLGFVCFSELWFCDHPWMLWNIAMVLLKWAHCITYHLVFQDCANDYVVLLSVYGMAVCWICYFVMHLLWDDYTVSSIQVFYNIFQLGRRLRGIGDFCVFASLAIAMIYCSVGVFSWIDCA